MSCFSYGVLFKSYLYYRIHSTFVLDAFKRSYSNEDTATKAIPFFWNNFEKEGWSVWKAVYNYPEELKKIFMASNLVSGMMQRIEKLRKNAFASVLILGVDNDVVIEGVWILRGQELAFNVSIIWQCVRRQLIIKACTYIVRHILYVQSCCVCSWCLTGTLMLGPIHSQNWIQTVKPTVQQSTSTCCGKETLVGERSQMERFSSRH